MGVENEIKILDDNLSSNALKIGENKEKKEIYYDGYFYDVTSWINKHPGGKVIELYTEKGESATEAFDQFHFRSKKARVILNSLKKRPAEIGEYEESARNKLLSEDFQKLTLELEKEGLFEPSPFHAVYRFSEVILLYLFGLYLFYKGFWKSAIFTMGICQGRGAMKIHENGHYSCTGNIKLDQYLTSFFMGISNGLSGSKWTSHHNKHHAMPQRFEKDVDIHTLPFVAFSSGMAKDLKKIDNFFTRNQAVLFLIMDVQIAGLFWKIHNHPTHVIKNRKYFEIFSMALHYCFLLYPFGFTAYLFANLIESVYLYGNFALSHTHLEMTDEPKHWVEYSLTHTANINPNPFVTWWMAYLNFQIEHHLFPAIPQFRLYLVSDRVKKLAEKHGLKYYCFGYFEAAKKTLKNLWDVSNEIKSNAKLHAQ